MKHQKLKIRLQRITEHDLPQVLQTLESAAEC
jgi:hypothetical protein